jgi:hypothetical protein
MPPVVPPRPRIAHHGEVGNLTAGSAFRVRTFVVGATPAGFVEEVSLPAGIRDDQPLTLLVVSSRFEQTETFRAAALDTDSIRAEQTQKSEAEFADDARDRCDSA